MTTVTEKKTRRKAPARPRRRGHAWLALLGVGILGFAFGLALSRLVIGEPDRQPPGAGAPATTDADTRKPTPHPIWAATFEGDDDLSEYSTVETKGAGEEADLTVSSKRARDGSKAARLSVPPSTSVGGASRNQSVADAPLARDGDDLWYGVSIWIGNSWDVSEISRGPDEFVNIVGFRWAEDADKYNGPGNGIGATRVDGTPMFTSSTIVGGPGESTGTTSLGPVVQAEWIDWVIHVKWSTEDDGLREIWRDGVKVATYRGPTMSRDLPVRHRIGLYQGSEIDHERILYWDNHRIGRSYADVDPSA